MLFSTAGMTLEFAVVAMRQRCWGCLAIQTKLYAKPGRIALARELSHPSSIAHALSFAAWFHQLRGEREAVQARVVEGMALATEQGFSSRRAQADFLEDGFWSNRVIGRLA